MLLCIWADCKTLRCVSEITSEWFPGAKLINQNIQMRINVKKKKVKWLHGEKFLNNLPKTVHTHAHSHRGMHACMHTQHNTDCLVFYMKLYNAPSEVLKFPSSSSTFLKFPIGEFTSQHHNALQRGLFYCTSFIFLQN